MAVRRFAVGVTTVAAAMLVLTPQASAQTTPAPVPSPQPAQTTPAPVPAPPTSWTVAPTPAPAPPSARPGAPVPAQPVPGGREPQVSRVPEGGVATGGGSSAVEVGWAGGLVALGALGLVGAVAARRRSSRG
jgi:hypothetical protein